MSDGAKGDWRLAELLVQNSVDGLAAIDREHRYTLWNRAMEHFSGKRAEEVLGKNAFDVFPMLREVGLDVAIDRALAGEVVTAEAVPNDLPDGSRRYYDRLYLPLRVDDSAIVGMLAVVRDVTSRRSAEDALRAKQEQLRLAVEAAGVGLWRWDVRADRTEWEDTMCALFGVPPGDRPKNREAFLAFVHPDDRARVRERVAAGVAAGRWEDEYRIVRPDGEVRWILAKGSTVEHLAVGAVLDVTERRAREEQLRQAQKVEAVGQLTAGIAHNFNNMLMGMLPNLEIAARRAPPDLEPLLRDAEQSAQRAAHVVRQLMAYAGRHTPTARTVESVAALVERTITFCRTTFDPRITIEPRLDDSARIRVDAAQFEQALLNLLINARDAVADVEAPRVTVTAAVVAEGASELDGRPGEFVRVEVADNGLGMDEPTTARVFEPFFSTKPPGKGTGLGLPMARAIVLEHGGLVACRSAPGAGARFTLYFPRELGELTASPSPAAAVSPIAGGETLLVVDDEPLIRRLLERVLTGAGYETLTASSGELALRRLGEADVALVILDVSMPGLSGVELRERIRALAPSARVLYFSGYAFEAPDARDGVLEKPASEAQLLAKVRDVLDQRWTEA